MLTAGNGIPETATEAFFAPPPPESATFLIWDESYNVGVTSLNDEHKQIFAAINAVQSAVVQQRDRKVIAGMLRQLAEATLNHFALEETMMTKTRYIGMALHILKHQHLAEQINAFIVRYERSSQSLNEHSLNFLRDWVTPHIQVEDRNFGLWLNEHGKY